MKLSDEQLRRAATLAREKELSQLPDPEDCPEYSFSAEFETQMQEILTQLEQGTLKPKPARMGWQYYTKRGAAAILIGFLLTCATMPETVMANCEKIIEMIETIFDEFTEFRFRTSDYTKDEFVPATLNYLPEGMKETKYRVSSTGDIYLRYENTQNYFRLEQNIISEESDIVYILDTEDAITEIITTKNGEVTIISKNGVYQYMLLHNSNLLVGDTDLPYDELIIILENIRF